ncbi:hypothetical protein K491DRAFT_174144, partial [Lophiostoma macrostomum CBS 122681]
CLTSYFLSDSSTQSFTTSCTTVTACTQTDLLTDTTIVQSCTPSAIPQCSGTVLVSGTATRTFTTECSTITACSGTGTTALTASTTKPTRSVIVDPLIFGDDWLSEQRCALSAIAANGESVADDVVSCFGGTAENSTATSQPPSVTSTDTASSTVISDGPSVGSMMTLSSSNQSSVTTAMSSTIYPSLDSSTFPNGASQQSTASPQSTSTTTDSSASPTSTADTIVSSNALSTSATSSPAESSPVSSTPVEVPTSSPAPAPLRATCLRREFGAPQSGTTDGSTSAQ